MVPIEEKRCSLLRPAASMGYTATCAFMSWLATFITAAIKSPASLDLKLGLPAIPGPKGDCMGTRFPECGRATSCTTSGKKLIGKACDSQIKFLRPGYPERARARTSRAFTVVSWLRSLVTLPRRANGLAAV